MPGPSEIEIRPLLEAADFGEALTPEIACCAANRMRNARQSG